jgi:hypothetical protein
MSARTRTESRRRRDTRARLSLAEMNDESAICDFESDGGKPKWWEATCREPLTRGQPISQPAVRRRQDNCRPSIQIRSALSLDGVIRSLHSNLGIVHLPLAARSDLVDDEEP